MSNLIQSQVYDTDSDDEQVKKKKKKKIPKAPRIITPMPNPNKKKHETYSTRNHTILLDSQSRSGVVFWARLILVNPS